MPNRRFVAPIILSVLFAAASISLLGLVWNSSRSASVVRLNAEHSLLVDEMQGHLVVVADHTAELVSTMTTADGTTMIDGDQDRLAIGRGGDSASLDQHPEVLASLDGLSTTGSELAGIVDGDDLAALRDVLLAVDAYAAAIAQLHELSDGGLDVMPLYHGAAQVFENRLRTIVLRLGSGITGQLQESVAQAKRAENWFKRIAPFLVLVTIISGGYLIRWPARRRRVAEISRLRRVNDERVEFIARVSHELRTPLTTVAGFLEILSDGEFADANEAQEIMCLALADARDLTQIVNDLLVVAQSEAGALNVLQEPVRVRDEAEQIINSLLTPDSSIELKGDDPLALGDPARVRQILRNLTTNAAKYGGDRVTVEFAAQASKVVVLFKDNGPGLVPEDWERVLKPYPTAHYSPGITGSIGLGLAVSRSLARAMGGDLSYSRQGSDSVFRLELRNAGAAHQQAKNSFAAAP